MSCYSFDQLAKFAFEKEIEKIRHKKPPLEEKEFYAMTYMEDRVSEIEKEYGEPLVRD